jgi:hypothetical protein
MVFLLISFSLFSLFLLLYLNRHRHPPSSVHQPTSLPDRPSTNHRLCPRHQPPSVLSTIVFVLVTKNRSDMQTGQTTYLQTVQILLCLQSPFCPVRLPPTETQIRRQRTDLNCLAKAQLERWPMKFDEWSSVRSDEWSSV